MLEGPSKVSKAAAHGSPHGSLSAIENVARQAEQTVISKIAQVRLQITWSATKLCGSSMKTLQIDSSQQSAGKDSLVWLQANELLEKLPVQELEKSRQLIALIGDCAMTLKALRGL